LIKIITAIGNENLNNELKKYDEFDIVGNDIVYLEGILDLLKNNQQIDYIILGEIFNNKIENVIKKIREVCNKIKIILIINKKNKCQKNELFKNGISEIFFEDENIDNIINYLKSKNIEYLNMELRAEINNLKKILLENNNKNNNQFNNYIIGFSGTRGIGKTTACILFARALKKKNKILIIDFDLNNSQIGELFNKKIDYSKINELDFNNYIFNVDNNIDILVGLNTLLYYRKINNNKIKNMISSLKKEYNYILVDTSIDNNTEINQFIFNCFDGVLLLSGCNYLDYLKTEKIIKIINQKYKIDKNKINIIYYRTNILETIKLLFKKKYDNEIKIVRNY